MKLTEQKPANAVPSNSPSRRTAAIRVDGDHEGDAPLPHETDQSAESQHEDGTRAVGRKAHQDLSRGLTDTDRRGGDAYQQRTQNDANTNSSKHKGRRKRWTFAFAFAGTHAGAHVARPARIAWFAAGTRLADISGTPLSQVLTTGGHHAHPPTRATSAQQQERKECRQGRRGHLSGKRSALDRRRNKNQTGTGTGSQETAQEAVEKLSKNGISIIRRASAATTVADSATWFSSSDC